MLQFYVHTLLNQVYALVQSTHPPQWQTTYPDGKFTRYPCLHMYARQAPDAGYPESECGLIPVHEAMFTAFMKKISLQQAEAIDLSLVQYARRIAQYPSLPQVLSQLPPRSQLFLMECDYSDSGHLFDVYRVQGAGEPLVCLTPLLAQLLPAKEYEGRPRLQVPLRGTYQQAGAWLVQAIEVRLWGSREHAPAYAYEVEC